MAGVDDGIKDLMKSMMTTSFIKSQQGNRITKKLLKRQGVHGYETGGDELLKSLQTNAEMMAQGIVALDRIPALKKAQPSWTTCSMPGATSRTGPRRSIVCRLTSSRPSPATWTRTRAR